MVEKLYINNRRFRVVKGHNFIDENGEIRFTGDGVLKDTSMDYKFYATNFGWNFAHDGVVYDKSDLNCRKAMRRLTCMREPEIPGMDARLRVQQGEYVNRNWDEIKEMVHIALGSPDINPDMEGEAYKLRYLPHDKRPLREDEVKMLWNTGDVAKVAWLRSVLWKFKTAETAKFGKYGRNIVDLGVGASLQTVPAADEAKHYLNSNLILYKGSCLEIAISPSPTEVTRQLKALWNHEYDVYMVAFSDDAVISIRDGDGYRVFNCDFKSCDSSHTSFIFYLMMDTLEFSSELQQAIYHQIMSPIRVVSCEDPNEKVMLMPTTMYLQSGIGITTLVNDFAQIVFFHALVNGGAKCRQDIERLSMSCGYMTELQECTQYEDAQFLKMSLALCNDGQYHALLNLGVILRCSGRSKYNVPGKGDYTKRCHDFQQSLMLGCLHNVSCEELEHLAPEKLQRKRGDTRVLDSMRHFREEETINHITFASYAQRYRLEPEEYTELVGLLKLSGMNTVVYSSAVNKIYNLDYGLSCPLL